MISLTCPVKGGLGGNLGKGGKGEILSHTQKSYNLNKVTIITMLPNKTGCWIGIPTSDESGNDGKDW